MAGTTRLFAVTGTDAVAAPRTTLAAAGLRERAHLQEWVLSAPEMLGDGLLVITDECHRWQSSRGPERDRFDVLAITDEGRLAVAELKRDDAPFTVEVQALKYAALLSRVTLRFLAAEAAEWRTRRGWPTTYTEAKAMILAHVGQVDTEDEPVDEDAVLDDNPRVVLLASSFHPTTLTTVLWLAQRSVDISLRTYQAHLVGEQFLVTVTQLHPLPGIEEHAATPAVAAEKVKAEKVAAARSESAVRAVIRAGLLSEGDELHLDPAGADADVVARWLAEEPSRGRATWTAQNPRCLHWSAPESDWPAAWGGVNRPESVTGLTRVIYEEAGAAPPKGMRTWRTATGKTIPELVGYSHVAAFDWSRLHAVLAAIPAGRWTTYGDLADLVGTAAQPLGQHIRGCPACDAGAKRVLNNSGRSAPNFTWTDPTDERTQQQALDEEGISFSADGVADPALRLALAEIEALAAPA